jgi:hypothetical protein
MSNPPRRLPVAEFQIREYALRMAREEVLALVADGRLSWEDLHARLEPGEISVLHEMTPSVNWYPVAAYDRLLTTLMDVEGGGSNEYLVERGKRAVESLTATGLEPQIEEARSNRGTVDQWWARVAPALVAMPSAVYSDSNWTLIPGEDCGRFTIEVTEASGLPESVRHTVQGVLESLATRLIGAAIQVTSGRPSPDKVVFRGCPAQ